METCDFKMKKHLQNLIGEDYGLTFWLCSESESLKQLERNKWVKKRATLGQGNSTTAPAVLATVTQSTTCSMAEEL